MIRIENLYYKSEDEFLADLADPRTEYPKILNKWSDTAGMVRVEIEWDDTESKSIIRANRKEPCVYPDCLQGRPCTIDCWH